MRDEPLTVEELKALTGLLERFPTDQADDGYTSHCVTIVSFSAIELIERMEADDG